MTLFTSPMARQFVGFETLFDELNKLSDRKEPNYPAYNIAKDDDEHYRIEVALAGFSADDISLQTEKGVLTIEAQKADDGGNYIHQGIAARAFSKMFRLALVNVQLYGRTSTKFSTCTFPIYSSSKFIRMQVLRCFTKLKLKFSICVRST